MATLEEGLFYELVGTQRRAVIILVQDCSGADIVEEDVPWLSAVVRGLAKSSIWVSGQFFLVFIRHFSSLRGNVPGMTLLLTPYSFWEYVLLINWV